MISLIISILDYPILDDLSKTFIKILFVNSPRHLKQGQSTLPVATWTFTQRFRAPHSTCSRCTEDDTHFTCFHHQIVGKCIRWQHLKVSRWASDVKLKALNVWDKTRNVTKSEVSNLLQTWHFKLTCEMLRCWLIWLQFCIATNLRRGVRSVASCPGAGFKVGSQKDIDIAMNLCSKGLHAHRVQSSPVDESVLTSHGCIPEFQRWPKSFEDL